MSAWCSELALEPNHPWSRSCPKVGGINQAGPPELATRVVALLWCQASLACSVPSALILVLGGVAVTAWPCPGADRCDGLGRAGFSGFLTAGTSLGSQWRNAMFVPVAWSLSCPVNLGLVQQKA